MIGLVLWACFLLRFHLCVFAYGSPNCLEGPACCVQAILVPMQAGVRHHVGELAVRKKRRLLARCFQYKRLLSRSLKSDLSAAQVMELVALKKQLGKGFGDNLSLRHVLEHIIVIQGELRRLGNRPPPNAFEPSLLVGKVVMGRMVGPRVKLLRCHLKCSRFSLSLANIGC